MYHKILLIGYLGKDPERRLTEDGKVVVNLNVATNRKNRGKDGTLTEETLWFRVVAWEELGEWCHLYLAKGRKVLVEGRLQGDLQTGGPRLWQKQDGTIRASFEVVAREIRFLDKASNGNDVPEDELEDNPTF